MKIFGFEIKRAKTKAKNYAAARLDRLTSDWVTNNLIADEIIKRDLQTIRNRSRDIAANNDYMKNFLRKVKVNVIGPNGITLQSKARLRNGNLDRRANSLIEEAWRQWSKKPNPSVCGTMSLRDILNLTIETIARDGEVLIRKVYGYDNPFGFSLQVIEADHLDEKLNLDLPNGNQIRLGIEKDQWGKPIAYHIFKNHPGDRNVSVNQKYIRIPADEIIHAYIKERPSQSRGIPWAHTAIIRLRMLGEYEEAAVVNARIGASKMGFIIPPEGAEYVGDDKDASGNTITEVEPGILEQLPPGADFKDFQTQYPNGEFPLFTKAMLRGAAAGIGCSYNSLASDLESVNYSSLRSGALEERDNWRTLQTWFIENVLEDIYSSWLKMAILKGKLPLNFSDIDRLNQPKWQPRTWEWVDPRADIEARINALKSGLTTRTAICAEQGIDFEDLIEQLAEEKMIMNQYGITFDEEQKDTSPFEYKEEIKTGGNGNGK